jgi:hypothetical protein
MKPRKIKNVKVPNRGLLSSDRSHRKKSHGGTPKEVSFRDNLNTTGEESIVDAKKKHQKGNHKSSNNNQGLKE